jgi:hypothetical protein
MYAVMYTITETIVIEEWVTVIKLEFIARLNSKVHKPIPIAIKNAVSFYSTHILRLRSDFWLQKYAISYIYYIKS